MELPYKSYYLVELTNMGLETAPIFLCNYRGRLVEEGFESEVKELLFVMRSS